MDGVCRPLDQLDLKGLNFVNGFLTVDGELKPHDPDYGRTYVLPYPYDPDKAAIENAPLFKAFLERCWSHNEDFEQKVALCQEAFGATLMGVAPQLQAA